jgi:copper chaperone CopZ
MKQLIIFCLFTSMLLLSACTMTGNVVGPTKSIPPSENIQETDIAIEGMTCMSCALGVKYELEQVEGVISADVDYATGTGKIRYDADKVDPQTVAKASTVYPANVVE